MLSLITTSICIIWWCLCHYVSYFFNHFMNVYVKSLSQLHELVWNYLYFLKDCVLFIFVLCDSITPDALQMVLHKLKDYYYYYLTDNVDFVCCVQYGLLQFIGHDEAMTILCRFVDPRDPASMLEAMKLLAAVCLVPPDGLVQIFHGSKLCILYLSIYT